MIFGMLIELVEMRRNRQTWAQSVHGGLSYDSPIMVKISPIVGNISAPQHPMSLGVVPFDAPLKTLQDSIIEKFRQRCQFSSKMHGKGIPRVQVAIHNGGLYHFRTSHINFGYFSMDDP